MLLRCQRTWTGLLTWDHAGKLQGARYRAAAAAAQRKEEPRLIGGALEGLSPLRQAAVSGHPRAAPGQGRTHDRLKSLHRRPRGTRRPLASPAVIPAGLGSGNLAAGGGKGSQVVTERGRSPVTA